MGEEWPLDIYLAGTEHIHLISELFGEKPESERMTGRTNRLACKYADLAMKCPNTKVIITDHYQNQEAHRQCFKKVCGILDVLGVDYSMGQVPIVKEAPGSFTGTYATGQIQFYVKVTPPEPLPF